MTRFVLFNVPAHGHINPTLPVVQALVQQGHEVIYYTTEEFREKIAPTGAIFRPYPEPVPSSAAISEAVSDGNLANVTRLLLRMSEHLMPFVLDELRREQPAFVIHDSIALWGSMAARLLDVPSVTSFTHFVFEGTSRKRNLHELWFMIRKALPILPEVIGIRQRLIKRYGRDVFQSDHLLPVRGDLNIVFTSEMLHPQSTWMDHSFHFVGPSIDTTTRPGSDLDLDYAQDKRRVYVSLGTVHNTNIAFYEQMFRVFADYPAQFILSTGQETDLASLGPVPGNFVVRNQVPQLDVLQNVDLFITHGGMNSIHEGLYFGVPLVMVPHQMEQVFNARVVEAQGAGVVVGDKPPFGHFSDERLRLAVDHALTDAGIQQQVMSVQDALRATGGYPQAAAAIVAFAQQVSNANKLLIDAD